MPNDLATRVQRSEESCLTPGRNTIVGEPTDNIFAIESFFHPSQLLRCIPYDFEPE
jgi:hypothetical protein